MSKLPSLSYSRIIRALQRSGFVVVRQTGSHIRLQKRIGDEVIKIIVPAHKPVKVSTLHKIVREAKITDEEFLENI